MQYTVRGLAANDELRRNHFGGMDWGELLKTLDFVTVSYIQEARQSPGIFKEFTPTSGFFNSITFPRGRHWLWLCSSKAGPKLTWVPAQIQLRHDGFVVEVLAREEFDVRVHFPPEICGSRTDLRYHEIGEIFGNLGRDAEVALEMLERVKGGFKASFKPYDGFLDAMIVLLFGVEAGRNCATCATSLMLLELIACKRTYGRQGIKLFTLEKAFHHATKTWDDGTLYGGKHPMATHGTGSGNLVDRGKVVGLSGVGWDLDVSSDPKHHMVIYRELSILRHWLELTELLDAYNQLSVKGRILKLLRTYLG